MITPLQKLFIDQNLEYIAELSNFRKIKKFFNENNISVTQEDLYLYVNNISPPLCEGMKFVSYSVGYRSCKKGCECYVKNLSEKVKAVVNTFTDEKKSKILEKRKITTNLKYGVDNVFQDNSIKNRSYTTKTLKYNDSNFNNRDKATNTCLEIYGVDNPAKLENIKQKIKSTNINKYGVDYALKSDEVKEKIKNTMFDRYGVSNPMQSDIIKEKLKQTNVIKYGVDNPAKLPLVIDKQKNTKVLKYGDWNTRIHLDELTVSRITDIDWLIEQNKVYSPLEIAKKLGISESAIYKIFKKN